MAPGPRKALLAAHLACSCGWIGMTVGYLALGIAATTSADPATVRAAWVSMEITGWFVLVPMSVGSLLTGIWLALASRWGLLRHYWVVVALAGTFLGAFVLVLHMPSVSRTADTARRGQPAELEQLGGDLVHATLGLVLLLLILVLNVYKPRGLTGRGWRAKRRIAPGAGMEVPLAGRAD